MDGYTWWYVDAVSDCERWALVIIAMIGSPFSPYYAAARRQGPTDPLDFCAMNAVLYGPEGRSWAMTERRGARRTATELAIGPSTMGWSGGALEIELDEVTAPLGAPLRGRVRLEPGDLGRTRFDLDARGDHAWWPIAPRSRAIVELDAPRVRFSGPAYHDANAGSAPLESAFRSWSWSRAATDRAAFVAYDVERLDGTRHTLDLAFDHEGVHDVGGRADHPLAPTGWLLPRVARSDARSPVRVVRTLEDTPFYSRSQVALAVGGQRAVGVHEGLSLERFRARWVQALLPARIRRAEGGFFEHLTGPKRREGRRPAERGPWPEGAGHVEVHAGAE